MWPRRLLFNQKLCALSITENKARTAHHTLRTTRRLAVATERPSGAQQRIDDGHGGHTVNLVMFGQHWGERRDGGPNIRPPYQFFGFFFKRVVDFITGKTGSCSAGVAV